MFKKLSTLLAVVLLFSSMTVSAQMVLYEGKSTKLKGAWESSNTSVVTTKGNLIKASGPGRATITTGSKSREVVVLKPSISLDVESMVIGVSSSAKIKCNVVGPNKKVVWKSLNSRIATVRNGTVVGKRDGVVAITATSNGVTATCEVTVVGDQVAIHGERYEIYVGDKLTLKTNIRNTVGKQTISWRSNNKPVATINNKGEVEALSPGTTTITANFLNKADTCIVSVITPKVDISVSNLELNVGEKYKFKINVTGKQKSVKWSSSDKTIAHVDKNGKLVAKKPGTVTVTATVNGVSDTATVTVNPKNVQLKLNKDTHTLFTNKGNTITLKYKKSGTNKRPNWASSDDSVVTVNQKGLVKAVGSGVATVTSSVGDVSDYCLIIVKESKVIWDSEHINMKVGDKIALSTTVVGKSKSTSYKTSNPKIVKVSKGKLYAVSNGEATVTARANGVSASCTVTVSDNSIPITKEVCNHEYVESVFCDSTCLNYGYSLSTCSACSDEIVTLIEPKGHELLDWEAITLPTKLSPGVSKRNCRKCSYSEKEIVNWCYGYHEYTDWFTEQEPTQTEVGKSIRHCTICGEIEVQELPMATHRLSDDSSGVCLDCNEYVPGVYNSDGYLVVPWDEVTVMGNELQSMQEVLKYKKLQDGATVVVDKSVTIISKGAFEGCENLLGIILPEGLTTIRSWAFSECKSLKSVYIPDTVTSLGDWVFNDCLALSEVRLPTGIDLIPARAFSMCVSLTELTIPVGVEMIGECAFMGCYSLRNVDLPDTVTVIGSCGFHSCWSLEEVVLPPNLENIALKMFYDCKGLRKINIPSSVKNIGGYAFGYCTNLSTITIPGTIENVGDGTFEYCKSLRSVVIEEGVLTLQSSAFQYCRNLMSVKLPNSLEQLGSYAFDNCIRLESVNIPNKLTSIEPGVFNNCNSITEIDLPDSVIVIYENAFANCVSLKRINIPRNVLVIFPNAFYNCTLLDKVELPDTIWAIHDKAFPPGVDLTYRTYETSSVSCNNMY